MSASPGNITVIVGTRPAPTPSEQLLMQPVSALIYKDGTTYRSMRGSDQSTIADGSDMGPVLRTTLAAFTGGGKILVKDGVYDILTNSGGATPAFRLSNNTVLTGESRDGTILRSANTISTSMCKNSDEVNGNSNIGVTNMTFDHSLATGGSPISWNKSQQCVVDGTRLKGNAATFTLYVSGGTIDSLYGQYTNNILEGNPNAIADTFGGGKLAFSNIQGNAIISGKGSAAMAIRLIHHSTVSNNRVQFANAGGLILESGYKTLVVNNVCENVFLSGFGSSTSTDGDPWENTWIGNEAYLCGGRGISANGDRNVIMGNRLMNNGLCGIEVVGHYSIIKGNICINNGTDTVNTASYRCGIRLTNWTNCIAEGNICVDDRAVVESKTQLHGIIEGGTANQNMIANNICKGNATSQITTVGAATVKTGNIEA